MCIAERLGTARKRLHQCCNTHGSEREVKKKNKAEIRTISRCGFLSLHNTTHTRGPCVRPAGSYRRVISPRFCLVTRTHASTHTLQSDTTIRREQRASYYYRRVRISSVTLSCAFAFTVRSDLVLVMYIIYFIFPRERRAAGRAESATVDARVCAERRAVATAYGERAIERRKMARRDWCV